MVMTLADEQYVVLTTFRKAGTPVPTAIWVVGLGSAQLGFWTAADSGKVKRVRSTARVTIQACDRRGRATSGAPIVEGRARLATPDEYAAIMGRITAKYGLMARAIIFWGKLGDRIKPAAKRVADVGIVVEVDRPA